MTKINRSNFIEYLKFLGTKHPKAILTNEKLESLERLNNQDIPVYLQLLYNKLGLSGQVEEDAFIKRAGLESIFQKIDEPPLVKNTSNQVNEPPVLAERNLHSYEIKQNPTFRKKTVDKGTIILEPNSLAARKSNTWKIIVAAVLVLGLAYLGYKFYAFQKLGYVYVLTDELLIRTSPDRNSKKLGSMNLFGKTRDRENVDIEKVSELKLYSNEKNGAYYKVNVGSNPFLSYLFGSDAGYVYSKFVTENKVEQETYQNILKPIKDDYYELKHLEFAYRAILVNAIVTQKELNGLVLKESCDIQPMNTRNAPLRIGQYQNNERTVFFVLVQLSDGNYYSIEGDGFYNALPAKPIYLDNELLSEPGKFQVRGDYFTWQNCDKTITARCNRGEFNYFISGE
jgi:hypothetical protein